MKCIDQERWQQKFEQERLTPLEKEKLRPTANVNVFSGLMKPEVTTVARPFLPEIGRKPLKKAGSIFWNEQRLALMKDYEVKYKLWKREKLRLLQNLSINIEMKDPFLICGKCGVLTLSLDLKLVSSKSATFDACMIAISRNLRKSTPLDSSNVVEPSYTSSHTTNRFYRRKLN